MTSNCCCNKRCSATLIAERIAEVNEGHNYRVLLYNSNGIDCAKVNIQHDYCKNRQTLFNTMMHYHVNNIVHCQRGSHLLWHQAAMSPLTYDHEWLLQ